MLTLFAPSLSLLIAHARPTAVRTNGSCRMAAPPGFTPPPPKPDDYVDRFCRGINYAMERTVFPPALREFAAVRDASPQGVSSKEQGWKTLRAPPELPGLSRPVWLTIAASVPTALGSYGWSHTVGPLSTLSPSHRLFRG